MYDSVIPNQVSKLGSTSTDIEIRIIEGTDNVNVLLQEVVRTRLEVTCYSQSGRECRVVTISTLTHSTLHQVGYSQSYVYHGPPQHVLSDFPNLYKCIFICDLEDTILIDFNTLLFVIAWASLLAKIIH